MKRVAVIGLGGIARKAYLPTLAARPLDLHLMTRSRFTLDAVADTHRVPSDRRFTTLDELIGSGIDAAFVHVPTTAHLTVVPRLLDAGVATYVDKPLDTTLEGSRELVEHAARAGVPLMVGFNRRHAPAYTGALDHPRDLIVLQKNQPSGSGPVREVIYDDFIHVADTLRFLAPGPIRGSHVSGRVSGGVLEHVALTLTGEGFTAIGLMHRLGGSKEEKLELSGRGRKREILNLTDVIDHHGPVARQPIDGWASVANQRGFEQICTEFLEGRHPGLNDALLTHELCEKVVTSLS
ncbi:Gfo/Idh/MocA family oxidoreductase [Actinocorallia longicatena]|uniref:Gfo/Idh/MocA family oxidoreductase n=1 Tax=Actinocorallia longicatena TaxID=111803 RepID=A0ABP6Q6K6_9ACTN